MPEPQENPNMAQISETILAACADIRSVYVTLNLILSPHRFSLQEMEVGERMLRNSDPEAGYRHTLDRITTALLYSRPIYGYLDTTSQAVDRG